MDAAAALDRARELVADGKQREAILLLRARVHAAPTSQDERRAFAQLYRELGHPDQAGRWGILIEGFTTAEERADFVSLLRNSQPTIHRVRSLLLLDRREDLPPEVQRALEQAQLVPATSRLDTPISVLLTLGGMAAIGTPVVVFVMAVFGASVQGTAIAGLVSALALFVLAALGGAIRALARKSRRIP